MEGNGRVLIYVPYQHSPRASDEKYGKSRTHSSVFWLKIEQDRTARYKVLAASFSHASLGTSYVSVFTYCRSVLLLKIYALHISYAYSQNSYC